MNPVEIDDKVFGALLDEIKETLDKFEQVCLRLEGKSSPEDLKSAFRFAHNIKGAAHVYRLTELGEFVHSVEDLLKVIKDKNEPVSGETVDLLLRAHSSTAEWVQGLRGDRKFHKDCSTLRGEVLAHVKALNEAPPVTGGTTPPPATAPNTATVGTAPVPAASPVTVGRAPAPSVAASDDGTATEAPAPAAHTEQARKLARTAKNKMRHSGTLRIQSTKIDEIIQIIGELSIHQSILWHNYNSNTLSSATCGNSVAMNQKALKDLYSLVLNLRMQPLKSLFQRIERSARDLARELNKELEVTFTGEDVFLDKTVIELMVDPLVHLVRNSIDHGLEDPGTRKAAGKGPKGRLFIEARQDVGQVFISISDDGRGIDEETVLRKAIEKKLIAPDAKPTRNEILDLIFLPGFSTREQVTSVSGRGVGMDVVRESVRQLSGQIDILTIKGKGTCFEIALPTSLEIMEGLVVRNGSSSYVVPMQDVAEIIDLHGYKVERLGDGGEAIQHRSSPTPVEDLSDYLIAESGKPTGQTGTIAKNVALVIILPDKTRLALRVDSIVAKQQIVVRPLSDQLSEIPGFIGVTVLGNGEPAMILSVSFIGDSYLNWIARSRRAS